MMLPFIKVLYCYGSAEEIEYGAAFDINSLFFCLPASPFFGTHHPVTDTCTCHYQPSAPIHWYGMDLVSDAFDVSD